MVSATRKMAVETSYPHSTCSISSVPSAQVSKNCHNLDLLKRDTDSGAPFSFCFNLKQHRPFIKGCSAYGKQVSYYLHLALQVYCPLKGGPAHVAENPHEQVSQARETLFT